MVDDGYRSALPDPDVEETEELLLRDQAPRAGVHVD